jgi:hypothetical protein
MHDAEVIEKIKQRVELCREYIQTLIDAIK